MTSPALYHPNSLYGDPVRLARYEAILADGHVHCAAMAASAARMRLADAHCRATSDHRTMTFDVTRKSTAP